MSYALNRNALYYPYIHVRPKNINWLKATLLCFRQVRRMAPPGFHFNDADEIKPFLKAVKIDGTEKPLLDTETTDSGVVQDAQFRLLETLRAYENLLVKKFTEQVARQEYGEKSNSFEIHRGKALDELWHFLEPRKLAWRARGKNNNPGEWFAVHPRLGEAIMSVIAIAIAGDKQLDIVTPSGTIHHALATLDEEQLLNNLLRRGRKSTLPPQVDKNAELADEVLELVLTTRFDVSGLTADNVAELIKEGKDLSQFKQALVPIVASIPDIRDPKERRESLETAANEVVKKWEEYRKSLPYYAAQALAQAVTFKNPDIVLGALSGAPGVAAATGVLLAAGIGLGIGLMTLTGMSIWRGYKEKANSPFRFLTRIHDAGASLIPQPVPVENQDAKSRPAPTE